MPKLEEVGLMNTKITSPADMDIPVTVKSIFLHNNQL
jgi:Leucine-rich repeat (LRR) protein